MLNKKITVTAYDYLRLRGFANPDVFIDRNSYLKKKLAKLLDGADIVSPWQIPRDVVTMNSKVQLKDLFTSEDMVLSLVFPPDADNRKARLSVLTPLGVLLIGCKAGHEVEGRRIKLEQLLYQPEASGDFHL